jgi:hypothetical protein
LVEPQVESTVSAVSGTDELFCVYRADDLTLTKLSGKSSEIWEDSFRVSQTFEHFWYHTGNQATYLQDDASLDLSNLTIN